MASETGEIHVLHVIASSRGGGAEHVRQLVHGLSSQGCQSTVVMPLDEGHVSAEDFALTARFVNLPLAEGFSARALVYLTRLVREGKFGIVHCHGMRSALYARLAVLPIRRRPKVLFTIHGFAAPYYPTPRRQVLLVAERLLAHVTDGWICVSEAERQALVASGVADVQRITVIRNGIAVDRLAGVRTRRVDARQALGLDPEAVVITTVCRLNRPRDFDTLLRGFVQVSRALPRARLLIVGDGLLRSTVEARIAEMGLGDRVWLLGARRDVPLILGASDIFVLSSAGWEGLPLTVLEAQAAGLPVVASDVGGTCEAMVDGGTGHLFPPGDAVALARCVLGLARDHRAATEMGERGAGFVRERMGVDRMVQETLVLYRHLLASCGQGEAA